MSFTFTLPSNIRQINNPWFHVECNTLQDYVVNFVKLPKDYHQIALESDITPSRTHRALHGKEPGRRSVDIIAPDEKAEMVDIIKQAVDYNADKFNYTGRSPRLQTANWLRYDPDLGCPPHCDDQDPADAEYGIGTTLFNWANQLVVLLYTSECGVDFTGGELLLHNQQQVIRPQRGEIVMFPATHTHIHSVQPILTGTRTVMQTTWRFDDRN